MSKAGLAAIILTKDEERDLPGCLDSLVGLADEVYVVDSGSTDQTVQLARQRGAIVLEHRFENYSRQLNWAIDNVPTRAAWLLRIDADERIDEEMRRSLCEILAGPPEDLVGVMLARRTQFMGKRLRFGGTFPVWLLRVWRRGSGRCEERWMDEHIVVDNGRVKRSRGELLHLIPKSVAEWSRKHIWYAERERLDVTGEAQAEVLQGQAGFKRRAKMDFYYRLPLGLRVVPLFFYRYVIQLGMLDGRVGFIYHSLQCGWYRLLVDSLLLEQELNGRREKDR